MILLLRQVAFNTPSESQSETVPEHIKTYQQALKFIADPILPVRAHGLTLMSDVVKSTTYDQALTPIIMGIFMNNVQEEDSYIYLNAVKGLAGMVDHLGKEVFTVLMERYSASLNGFESDSVDRELRLDNTLRLGEALSMIVRRSGKAISVYGKYSRCTRLSSNS